MVEAKQEDPVPVRRHLAQAFMLVNQRLSQADALSDNSIAVVVMLTHFERLRGRYFKGLVHLDGLCKMVEMRGGIVQLTRDQPSLGQKVTR